MAPSAGHLKDQNSSSTPTAAPTACDIIRDIISDIISDNSSVQAFFVAGLEHVRPAGPSAGPLCVTQEPEPSEGRGSVSESSDWTAWEHYRQPHRCPEWSARCSVELSTELTVGSAR